MNLTLRNEASLRLSLMWAMLVKVTLSSLIIQRLMREHTQTHSKTPAPFSEPTHSPILGKGRYGIAIITINDRVTFRLETIFSYGTENYFLSNCLCGKKTTHSLLLHVLHLLPLLSYLYYLFYSIFIFTAPATSFHSP